MAWSVPEVPFIINGCADDVSGPQGQLLAPDVPVNTSITASQYPQGDGKL
jgi:hypothetical protein